MHPEAYAYVRRVVRDHPDRRLVVELGAKDINGSVRPLFAKAARYVGVDCCDGPGVDVVQDAARYWPPFTPDTIVLCEVLEHTPKGAKIIANAHRMLSAGGLLIVTAAGEHRPCHSGVDGGRLRDYEYYDNVSEQQLATWLAPFARFTIEVDVVAHDIRAVAVKAE